MSWTSLVNQQRKQYIVKNRRSIYWSLICRAAGNSLVHNMSSGPNCEPYFGADCCYAGTVLGTGGTMLGKL
jgi:hypothetical protein